MSGKRRIVALISVLVLALGTWGCGHRQDFVRGAAIRARARQVAVLPLVNLTAYPNAGRIVGDLLTTEIMVATPFQVIESTRVVEQLRGDGNDLEEAVDRAEALKVGQRLGVDTVVFGSVTEYRYKRGLDEDPVVGINIRLLDVPGDRILWAGSHSGTGGCFWLCEDSLNRLAQRVCRDLVSAMVKAP